MQGLLAVFYTLLLTLGFNPHPASQPASAPATQPARPLTLYETFRLTQEDTYDHLIVTAAEDWQLDPFLLKGLLWYESKFQPDIVNPTSRAAGIAQFVREGLRGLKRIRKLRGSDEPFTRRDAFNPEKAIPASAELLSYLTRRWGALGAIKHYNGGRSKDYFLIQVLKHTNRYRTAAGLPPLPGPRPKRPKVRTLTVS
jgi:soluble lytic murein transglycosylase-like protein